MILKKISIKNFKSIYDELVIDFDDIKGFWKIEGSVGAGKTTIGEAIIYGLFGSVKGKTNRELISWGEKKCTIIIDCISKGHYLHIDRTIGHDLDVLVDNEPLVFTNKRDAQSQLEEEYYDVSRMTLELLCIISFNNFKSLANLNTTDSKLFLDQVFGFYTLTNYSDICKIKRKEVYDELSKFQSQKNSLVSQIRKIEDLSNIERIEGESAEIKEEIKSVEKSRKEFENKFTAWDETTRKDIRALDNELTKIKTLGTNKAKEIKFIEQGKCPTCGAPIDQSQLEIKKAERDVLLKQYNEINDRLKSAQTKYEDDKKKLKREDDTYVEQLREFRKLLTKLEEQEKRLNINTKEIEQLKVSVKEVDEKITELEKDITEWEQLQDILSIDVRQKILSSFIPLLNKSVNEYTRQLQLPYIVSFDNQFRCNINIFGVNSPISIASLSTGQCKSLDTSIILGVLKVIFSGVKFNIMFLDELFSNLDSELRNTICKVLKNEINDNQTIFIISHQELPDTYFDGSIHAELHYKSNSIKQSKYSFNSVN